MIFCSFEQDIICTRLVKSLQYNCGPTGERAQISGAGAGPAGPAAAVPIFSLKKKKKRRLSHWKIACRFHEACLACLFVMEDPEH